MSLPDALPGPEDEDGGAEPPPETGAFLEAAELPAEGAVVPTGPAEYLAGFPSSLLPVPVK